MKNILIAIAIALSPITTLADDCSNPDTLKDAAALKACEQRVKIDMDLNAASTNLKLALATLRSTIPNESQGQLRAIHEAFGRYAMTACQSNDKECATFVINQFTAFLNRSIENKKMAGK